MLKVVHCKREKYDIYIGRGSKWGNPYRIGQDGTRAEVIEKYEEYLKHNFNLLNALDELKDKVLGCWCKPKDCHGDILIKYIKKYCKEI